MGNSWLSTIQQLRYFGNFSSCTTNISTLIGIDVEGNTESVNKSVKSGETNLDCQESSQLRGRSPIKPHKEREKFSLYYGEWLVLREKVL